MKISVIIPVYNAEKYLTKCLDSVKNQTFHNWEAIAIDDGSTDGSYTILHQFACQDNRFSVSTQANQGPGRTRNIAIEQATGDFIVFIDSDDYIENDYFESINSAVEAEGSDVIFTDVILESLDGKFIRYEKMSTYACADKDTIIRHQMTGKLPWGGCRKVVRTTLLNGCRIRYSRDTVGEEALFSFQVLSEARKITFLRKAFYHYVKHPDSQSQLGDEDPWGKVCESLQRYLSGSGQLVNYEKTVNSFAYTALVISIYRIVRKNQMVSAIKKSRIALDAFKIKYSFKLDRSSLEQRTRALLFFIQREMLLPVILIAKIKILITS